MKKRQKVALGMSGGVDSSLSAHLLVEQGYDVTGVYLECWRAPGCRTEVDRKDALKVALSLNISFQVLDFKQTYRDKVVEYFFDEYQAGRTPNPDVLCNKEIKFGLFYDWAIQNEFEYVATGHYAAIHSIEVSDSHKSALSIPADTAKDQSYFLYLLTEEKLDHILFPLQDLKKDQVRAEAANRNLHNAEKKDSVGICFIGDINVHDFLEKRLGKNPGEVVNTQGSVIGTHDGLWFYTIGQRHGFRIDKKTVITLDDGSTIEKQNIPPFYVIDKLPDTNQLVVGFGAETQKQSFKVSSVHWIDASLSPENALARNQILVRIRHTGDLLPCELDYNQDSLHVRLQQPVKGIASGQAAVFYVKNDGITLCLGGGLIT